MSIALEEATTALRCRLLAGDFDPGTKLREISVAEDLGVSRTLARLAMSALEHEGLLTREPNRGSRVKRFSIKEIADAIEVRGELEAMAVRQAAERGLDAAMDARLEQILGSLEEVLAQGVTTDAMRDRWVDLNSTLHDCLVEASGNWALKVSISQMSRLPLVSPSALIFDRKDHENGHRQLVASHADHVEIVAAIRARQGHRAEARMREHAFMNARNKILNLADPETMDLARALPGGPLIRPDK
ncbi:GntR family transcriptional regulator [Maricaulis sp.]|uniref:GntR family transcriptional regulator n=1 Tax=Maricaulis sp. TaxID=1486257 RepID=UPI00260D86D1|nr:GntR family transcriptional regulator [Maricaulis sp.]